MKEIKLPKTIKDLRISHLQALTNEQFGDTMSDEDIVKFVSIFAGISEQEVLTIVPKDVVRMYNHLAEMWDEFKPRNTPPVEIVINGKTYRRADPNKEGYGWHIDWKRNASLDDPIRLACMMYIPMGVYGAMDENSNMINPISERYEDFKNDFPLTTYLESQGFFLHNWLRSTTKLTLQRKAHQMAMNSKILKRLSRSKTKN